MMLHNFPKIDRALKLLNILSSYNCINCYITTENSNVRNKFKNNFEYREEKIVFIRI